MKAFSLQRCFLDRGTSFGGRLRGPTRGGERGQFSRSRSLENRTFILCQGLDKGHFAAKLLPFILRAQAPKWPQL